MSRNVVIFIMKCSDKIREGVTMNGAAERNAQVVLTMTDIDKRFPGVHALKKCQLELRKGEVLALVGENGAGKSTLMKILTGIYTEYDGSVVLEGSPVHFANITEAQRAGISIVHQELNMLNHLTVAKNIFLGRESKGFLYDESELNQRTQQLIDKFRINVQPTDKIGSLSVGKAQMVEIARAMSYPNTKVLILDEPTASLSNAESLDLFGKMADLKKRGIAMIFISHRLGEIKQISDRITVMRDGEYVGTVETEKAEIHEIIRMMVGREILQKQKNSSAAPKNSPVTLEANGLRSRVVKDVSFKLRRGEILGFAGLVGAGRTETARLLFGADKMDGGEIILNGKPVSIQSPQDAVRQGIAYLSEDRKRNGLLVGLSVMLNAVLPSLDKFSKKGIVNHRSCAESVEKYVRDLSIKTPSVSQLVKNLSGGNQQKVIIAKWLIRDTNILIFDEPTRGIDIGAKAEIYALMTKLAESGKSIIMISSDLTEILRMSDRVVVMCEGRVTAELDIAEAGQENIMRWATAYC
jgi:ribose transport system ATP-binding protein